MRGRHLSSIVIARLEGHPQRRFADGRDAFLGLMKTCGKLGVSFRDYLGSRLGIMGTHVPNLASLVAAP
ncbi:MAG: hypothetical protein H7840_16975 [Alphaproteobacteria bacterium]